MMAKQDTSLLRSKISSKEKQKDISSVRDRFRTADETFDFPEEQEKKSQSLIIRKTISIPETELPIIEKIKDKALNKRIPLSDSEVIRLGLLIASGLSDQDLEGFARKLEKIPLGKPRKKK